MNEDEIYANLVAEKIRANTLYDFYGQNCDDCPGWDGQSNRCECGNRRVAWVLSDCKTFVYGEAH
jgi:hypothetical protein